MRLKTVQRTPSSAVLDRSGATLAKDMTIYLQRLPRPNQLSTLRELEAKVHGWTGAVYQRWSGHHRWAQFRCPAWHEAKLCVRRNLAVPRATAAQPMSLLNMETRNHEALVAHNLSDQPAKHSTT